MLKLLKKGFYVFLILNALILSACSTMSEMDCLDTNWEVLGYEDGVQGRDNTHISTIHPYCTELGLSAHLNAYLAGHAEGLELYCLENNGLFEGRSGKSYLGVCPDHLEPDFMLGFIIGQEIYSLQEEKIIVDNQIFIIEEELDKIEGAVNAIKSGESQGFVDRTWFANSLINMGKREVFLEAELLALQQEQVKIEQRISRLESEFGVEE